MDMCRRGKKTIQRAGKIHLKIKLMIKNKKKKIEKRKKNIIRMIHFGIVHEMFFLLSLEDM